MKRKVLRDRLKVDRVGDSLTDWGKEFQRLGEVLEVSMGGGDVAPEGILYTVGIQNTPRNVISYLCERCTKIQVRFLVSSAIKM